MYINYYRVYFDMFILRSTKIRDNYRLIMLHFKEYHAINSCIICKDIILGIVNNSCGFSNN